MNSPGIGFFAAIIVAGTTSCGTGPTNPNSRREVPASALGLASLFEAECLEWRSIRWAEREYENERAACIGEITAASIADCRSNVTGVDWSVRAANAPLNFKVSYFFDEVERPSKAEASCQVLVPKELGGAVETAARNLASKHSLAGPFRSGERGFSIPTLREYWTDNRGRPRIGVYYYPADVDSSDPVEKEHAAYPWTLMQWQENVRY